MKSNQKEIEVEKLWQELSSRIQENLKLTLIVLHKYYGFGGKRLNQFADHLMEESQRFNEYSADGADVCRNIFERELRDIKDVDEALITELCAPSPMFRKKMRHQRMIEKKLEAKVSFSEAEEMRRQLEALRNLQNGVKPNG